MLVSILYPQQGASNAYIVPSDTQISSLVADYW